MKKVLSILLAAGFVAIVACGPSAEEQAAAETAAAATQSAMTDSAAAMATPATDSSAMMSPEKK